MEEEKESYGNYTERPNDQRNSMFEEVSRADLDLTNLQLEDIIDPAIKPKYQIRETKPKQSKKKKSRKRPRRRIPNDEDPFDETEKHKLEQEDQLINDFVAEL